MKIIRKFKNLINRKCDGDNRNFIESIFEMEKKLGQRNNRAAWGRRLQRKQNVTRKYRNRCSVTHHENHEPWLQVGAPDVSLRFQPPWWSPGWYPFPLHFDADCPFFFFFPHTQHSRGKKRVDLTLPRLRAHWIFFSLFCFLSASQIWRRKWKDAENYCRREKCDI